MWLRTDVMLLFEPGKDASGIGMLNGEALCICTQIRALGTGSSSRDGCRFVLIEPRIFVYVARESNMPYIISI